MMELTKPKKIFLASESIDFRCSIDALTEIVVDSVGSNPYSKDTIYVFYNKDMSKIKCLFWDSNGFVMYYKKLESLKFKISQFKLNKNINYDDLQYLLSGMNSRKGLEAK